MITPRRQEILDSYNKYENYVLAGEALGISKQRVHQVVKGYGETGRRKGRIVRYRECFKKICENCNIHRSKFLHHKDGNNKNDVPENLISVCKNCHKSLHIELRGGRGYQMYKICQKCKKEFNIGLPHAAKGLCAYCLYRSYFNPLLSHKIRNVDKGNSCIDCKKPFNKNSPYRAKLRCKKCYGRYLYATSPERRKYMQEYYKNYKRKK